MDNTLQIDITKLNSVKLMNKKVEKITILSFLALGLVTSLIFIDFFPFSLNPLFTKADNEFTFIDIKTLDGKQLNHSTFSVHIDYASIFEIQGIDSPMTINKFGKNINSKKLVFMLKEKILKYPGLSGLKLYIYRIGQIGSSVGIKNREEIYIRNPLFLESEKIDSSIFILDKYIRRIKSRELL